MACHSWDVIYRHFTTVTVFSITCLWESTPHDLSARHFTVHFEGLSCRCILQSRKKWGNRLQHVWGSFLNSCVHTHAHDIQFRNGWQRTDQNLGGMANRCLPLLRLELAEWSSFREQQQAISICAVTRRHQTPVLPCLAVEPRASDLPQQPFQIWKLPKHTVKWSYSQMDRQHFAFGL